MPSSRRAIGIAAGILASLLLLKPVVRAQTGSATAPESGGEGSGAPSSTAGQASQITESLLVGLPLNGRSYSQLATLQGGVSDPFAGSASRGGGSGGLTISGGRATSNNFLLDGTNIMNVENRVPQSAAGVQLGSDAVFQVHVFATNYAAEYGRGSGGVLNTISRSGTPQLHGTLFEYFRNSKLDARNFFDPGPEPTPFKRNQFGMTATGPLAKDRTFWMGSFEGLRDRLTESNVDFYPDDLSRQGIISDAEGQVIQIVPVHPAVKPYLALYPIPNLRRVGRGAGENVAPQFFPTDEIFFTVRLDHKISDRDSLFARYTFDDATSDSAQPAVFFQTRTQSRQQYLTVVGTRVFNPRLIASVRLGYTRPVAAIETVANLEIPRSLFFVPDFPQFGQISIPSLSSMGPTPNPPEVNIMNTFQGTADVLAQKGQHALKAGMDVHRYRWDVFSSPNKGGHWSFSSLESFLQAGPSGTTLWLALPGSQDRKSYRETLVGLYVQDAYRASSRLQFNAGLRYEFATLLHDRDGKDSYLSDPARDRAVQTGALLARNPSLRNVSPRLGFSWSPFAHADTVVSGGFGIYYDQLLEYVVDNLKSTQPYYRMAVNPNFDSSSLFPDVVAAVAGIPLQARILDYRRPSAPMVLRYNFTLQQPMPGGWNLRASYVGARGNHLYRSYEANLFPVPIVRPDGSLCFPPDVTQNPPINPSCPPVSPSRAGPVNPAFAGITVLSSDAQSFYNSLQISASRSAGRGTSLQASYTFSKSVDDASSHTSFMGASQYGFLRTLDRGLSDFDLRHRLSVNYFYTFPFGKGLGWLTPMFRGWRLGGIFTLRTGTPFTPVVNMRAPGYLFSAGRPNLLPGRSKNPIVGTVEQYFDPSAFSPPPFGTLGNLGRNTVISPNVFFSDLSVQRDFALDSKRQLQFRADIFNVTNHPNFNRNQGATTIVFSGTSSRPNGNAGRLAQSVTTARQIQFALRFSF